METSTSTEYNYPSKAAKSEEVVNWMQTWKAQAQKAPMKAILLGESEACLDTLLHQKMEQYLYKI